MKRTRLRLAAVLAAALVLHVAVLGRVEVAGVRPDLLLLAAATGGLVLGPDRGAVVGFAAGLLGDLFIQAPLGLSALVFAVIAYGVGSFQSSILRAVWWIPVATALVASAAGVVLYALMAATVGRPDMVTPRLAMVALVVALGNAALAPVALRVMNWAR